MRCDVCECNVHCAICNMHATWEYVSASVTLMVHPLWGKRIIISAITNAILLTNAPIYDLLLYHKSWISFDQLQAASLTNNRKRKKPNQTKLNWTSTRCNEENLQQRILTGKRWKRKRKRKYNNKSNQIHTTDEKRGKKK